MFLKEAGMASMFEIQGVRRVIHSGAAATPPGSALIVHPFSGGVAALNRRLMAASPPGCDEIRSGSVHSSAILTSRHSSAPKAPGVEFNGTGLLVGGKPFFPRLVEYRGEPLSALKKLGFNGVRLSAPATHHSPPRLAPAGSRSRTSSGARSARRATTSPISTGPLRGDGIAFTARAS